MVRVIVTYIKTKEEKYYQEKDGVMKRVDNLSETGEIYRWWFYNEVAESKFLAGYIYDEIDGIPVDSIVTMHDDVYMKMSL